MKQMALTTLPLLVVVAACVTSEMPTISEGQAIYAENCVACHDYDAQGADALIGGQPAPDLTRIAARNGGVLPRAEVLSQIDGYHRSAEAVAVMPEFGALLEGPTVPLDIDGTLTPTPRALAAVLTYLESIQQP